MNKTIEITTLGDGYASLEMPLLSELSQESAKELYQWLKLVKKKIIRLHLLTTKEPTE